MAGFDLIELHSSLECEAEEEEMKDFEYSVSQGEEVVFLFAELIGGKECSSSDIESEVDKGGEDIESNEVFLVTIILMSSKQHYPITTRNTNVRKGCGNREKTNSLNHIVKIIHDSIEWLI